MVKTADLMIYSRECRTVKTVIPGILTLRIKLCTANNRPVFSGVDVLSAELLKPEMSFSEVISRNKVKTGMRNRPVFKAFLG